MATAWFPDLYPRYWSSYSRKHQSLVSRRPSETTVIVKAHPKESFFNNSPVCAARGTNYLDGSKTKSYFKVLISKTAQDVVVRVDAIYRANKRRARYVVAFELVVVMLATTLLLMLPPNVPEWY